MAFWQNFSLIRWLTNDHFLLAISTPSNEQCLITTIITLVIVDKEEYKCNNYTIYFTQTIVTHCTGWLLFGGGLENKQKRQG